MNRCDKQRPRSNEAMERTAAWRAFTFPMIKRVSAAVALALGGGRSACVSLLLALFFRSYTRDAQLLVRSDTLKKFHSQVLPLSCEKA